MNKTAAVRRHRFRSPCRWFAAALLLSALALAVRHAEESQLFSSEAVWKAVALCALGALVQALGSLLGAFRRPGSGS